MCHFLPTSPGPLPRCCREQRSIVGRAQTEPLQAGWPNDHFTFVSCIRGQPTSPAPIFIQSRRPEWFLHSNQKNNNIWWQQKLYEIQISACINKVYYLHSHAHSCMVYSCFHDTVAELGTCNRDHMVHKASNTEKSGLLQKKCAEPWSI